MEEVAQYVDYASFASISVERFSLLSRLVRYDLYSDGTDEHKADWLEVELAEIAKLREMKEYPRVVDRVRKAFMRVTTPKMFKEHLDDPETQDKLFRAMMRKGLGKDLKFGSRLMEKLAEATVPRALPASQAVIIQIGEEHARLIAETLNEVKHIGEGSIDAEYSEIQPGEAPGDEGTGKA
jgi:hypothetical protein